jgi:Mn-dependent DtxR family transcriptional regulator
MKDKIGETAGGIWQILKKKGEVNMGQLPRLMKEKSAIVYQGLGWLAREGKIEYQTREAKTFVSLSDVEKVKE